MSTVTGPNIVEDKAPAGALTEKSAFDETMFLAGTPGVNPETAEIEREQGIQSPPPPSIQTLDPHIKLSDENKAPIENNEQPPSDAQPVQMDILDKLLKGEPAPAPTSTPDSQQPVSFTQEQVNDMIANALAQESLKYEKQNKLIEEFEKNPYEFYARYSPAVIQDFDVTKYVNSKLTEEFGAEFQVVPEEIGIYGSESNKFLKRQMDLEREALSLKDTAQQTVQNSEKEQAEQLNALKSSIMTEYGVSDEASFDPLWNEIRSLTKEQVFKRLAQHALILRDIDKVKKNIKQPVNRAFSTPGISDIIQPAENVNGLAANELAGLYSEQRLKEYNIIR